MSKKIPVLLKPYQRTEYAYDKLRVCGKCGSYTVLSQKLCPVCGKRKLVDVPTLATRQIKRKMRSEWLFAALLALVAMFCADSTLWLSISAAAGVIAIAALIWVQHRMFEPQLRIATDQLFARDQNRIRHGLIQDIRAAEGLLQAQPAQAYEMLREVNTLLRNDPIKGLQTELLQLFVLRRDMDLLVDSLIMDGFSAHLAGYLGEVAKLNPELIKERSIRYCIQYEPQIRNMYNGEFILAAVAGASVRMKRYIELYPEFIRRYTHKFPTDRLERLRDFISQNPGRFPALKLEADEVYRRRLGSVPTQEGSKRHLHS